ncbi:MAG: M20/M25/M40 family metallo-hydrolase [Phycisphaerales bacterium]
MPDLTPDERRVRDLLEQRRDALLEDLRLHVALPTGQRNTTAVDETREIFGLRCERLGARLDLIPGDPAPWWLYGTDADAPVPPTLVARRTRPGRPNILIAGHLDTVHDPHGPFRTLTLSADGQTATGPGCVDMKGGLVIAMAALEALEEAGVEVSWSFLMNSDEETGSYHSFGALQAEARRHDLGLALEPALPGGALATVRSGSGQFMVETRGRSAHVGREFTKGVSAVSAMAERLLAIASFPEPDKGVVANVGPLEGGAATNAVPDRARAWGNVRFPDPDAAKALESRFHTLATPQDAMPACDVHTSFNRPAKPLTPESERLALAARDAAEALGQALPFASTGGVCDGNILQDAGLPTIDTLGVRGGGLHTPDEWIEIPSLVERSQLLAVLMMRVGA